MRILLIAYEFPPSASPQSLRWAYLCRELANRGHDVHVLTIDLGGHTPGLPSLPASVTVHSTFAGPFRGLFAARRKFRARKQESAPTATAQTTSISRSGWKQRLSQQAQSLLAAILFPDARGEWLPWARVRLRRLLKLLNPDLVISSHEPATTLQLGLLAKRQGYRWIADLGDPVLATYTPKRWQSRAEQLESVTCREADQLIVTTETTRALLISRHKQTAPITVISQGFDQHVITESELPIPVTWDQTELLYTGSLYQFRRIDALLEALEKTTNIRLNIASIALPESLVIWMQKHPNKIRLLGFLPHSTALQLQRKAHILINIANDDPDQIPGKIYEYLGARRPVLHIRNTHDAISDLLQRTNRGWPCCNDAEAITTTLNQIIAQLPMTLPECSTDEIIQHSWQALALQVEALAFKTLKKEDEIGAA